MAEAMQRSRIGWAGLGVVVAVLAQVFLLPAAWALPQGVVTNPQVAAGDGAIVVHWAASAPGAARHVVTVRTEDGRQVGQCTATVESFCTVTGLSNTGVYRVAVAGVTDSIVGAEVAVPGYATPVGRCTPLPSGPPNPAMVAAINARLAESESFRARFGADLNRLAPCNPDISDALRRALAAAIAAEPDGAVARAMRQAIIARETLRQEIARNPGGPAARLFTAIWRITPPLVTYPATVRTSEGHFLADGQGARYGPPGVRLVTYTVEAHPDLAGELGTLLRTTDAVLGNGQKGWIAGGTVALQRINDPTRAAIRIVLARPGVVDYYCGRVGLDTAGLYSCWDGRRTMLNSDRWFYATRDFPDLSVYRTYLINHEFGHGLGYGHAYCSRPGALAPVMMQQSISIGACRPNGWPYP